MECLRVSQVDTLPTGLARTQREVHLFKVEEESLIKSAQRIEKLTSHEEERTYDLIHGSDLFMMPFDHGVTRAREDAI